MHNSLRVCYRYRCRYSGKHGVVAMVLFNPAPMGRGANAVQLEDQLAVPMLMQRVLCSPDLRPLESCRGRAREACRGHHGARRSGHYGDVAANASAMLKT